MGELERWLTGLVADPQRMAAFLIGAGMVLALALPLIWRFASSCQMKAEKAERTREKAETDVRTLKADLDQAKKRLEKLEQVYDRLATIAPSLGVGVKPEEVPNKLLKRLQKYKVDLGRERGRKPEESAQLREQLAEAEQKRDALRKERDVANKERDEAVALLAREQAQLEQAQRKAIESQSEADEARQLLVKQEATAAALGNEVARLEREAAQGATWNGQLHELGSQLTATNAEVDQLTRENERLRRAAEEPARSSAQQSKQSGQGNGEKCDEIDLLLDEADRIWERPVVGVPPFKPLTIKRPPIISILNLKGGVGKTTVTTNLGATWWAERHQVLLIDLDFQASLTLRCLPLEQAEASPQNHVQAMFQECLTGVSPSLLLRRIRSIPAVPLDAGGKRYLPQLGQGHILTASESLADVETSLMIRWLLGRVSGDLRYWLRQLLHSQEVWDRFGYILIDCPPRLTTACVNALAASDLVLVPVLADDTSLERVHVLLGWLKRFRDCGVCPNLTGVAVLRNRFRDSEPQRRAWQRAEGPCRDAWPGELSFLEEVAIKDDPTALAEASENHFPAVLRGTKDFVALRQQFTKLASDLDTILRSRSK